MAKRRRLTPASPDYLGPGPGPGPERAPEVKSAFAPPARPPIAQVAGETSAAAALGELTEMVTRARAEGRLVQALALAEIDAAHLVRDRLVTEEEDLQNLMASLRGRGQQTPVEVVDRGPGAAPRYGLISGWRRIAALGRLAAEDPRFATVLALVRSPATASEAYVAMVEENEIRVGLSFYERARIVVQALEQGVYGDPRTALQTLFANVPRAKRSKIKSFMAVVQALDGALAFPTAIGERLGLALARALGEDPGLGPRIRAGLEADPPGEAAAELAHLAAELEAATAADPPVAAPAAGPELSGRGVQAPAPRPAAPSGPSGPGREAEPQRPVAARFDPRTGTITLTGPAVSAALCAALVRWLEEAPPPGT